MKILLYSGGMDSWLIDKLWKPDLKLYVDIFSKYSTAEMARLADDVQVEHSIVCLEEFERADAIIPLRNLYLALVAANVAGAQSDDGEPIQIMLGATAGDRVLDKSTKFARMATDMLSFLWSPQHWTKGREIEVLVDYKDHTKVQLIQEAVDQGLCTLQQVFEETYSCYEGKKWECWRCKPCLRKMVAVATVDFEWVWYYHRAALGKVVEQLEREIIPQIQAGNYGRGRDEETDILNVVNRYNKRRMPL
jgi:7-cyano-7-deazaguanine synthase